MSTVLLININSLCMEQQITHFSGQSDYKKLLHTIEEQLVIKEIKKCGIEGVETRLYSEIRSQIFCQPSDEPKKKSILKIKRRCFQPKIKKSLLAQSVFNLFELQGRADFEQESAIRRKSNEELPRPSGKRGDLQKIETLSHLIEYYSPLPKHFLSDQIRCYFIKNQPAVLVVAQFTDAKQVQKIIDTYKSTMVNNKSDNNRINNNEGNNAESDSSEESNNSDDSDESDNDVSYKCPFNPMPMCTLFALVCSYLLIPSNPGQ